MLRTIAIGLWGMCVWTAAASVAPEVVAQQTSSERSGAAARPRVIVLTDITNEPDDQESLVRYLVYANEFETEALIATTSVWLRANPRADRVRELVRAYGKVHGNLSIHAEGFPSVDSLLDGVRTGQNGFGMDAVGTGKSTEGSRRIIEVVDRPDERPVWVSVWGGANTLAQALWEVKERRSAEDLAAFVGKLRVYSISDQDDAGHWLRRVFPDLFYIVSPSSVDHWEYHRATWTGISGERYYRNGSGHLLELVSNEWLTQHIIEGHGPLGAMYPKWEFIMEGDTPSFLGLIDNGLGWATRPDYGGWGGRYQLHQAFGETRPIWTNTRDSRDTVTASTGVTETTDQATIWRWRRAYQHDFAARMDWCIADAFEKANHNPALVVNGHAGKAVIEIPAKAGQTMKLSAAGSGDPDGDSLTYRWFHYREAGSFDGEVAIEGGDSPTIRFTAPRVPRSASVHLILEAHDDGEPSLYSYRRVVLAVEP